MGSPVTAGESQERATVREVYTLVNEVREDLGARVDKVSESVEELSKAVNVIATSHEHRLTVLEETQAAHSTALVTINNRLDSHGASIGGLKDQQNRDEAATKALTDAKAKRGSRRQWAIGLAVLVASSVIGTLLGIFVH
jgi:chromosome segregation ATPase